MTEAKSPVELTPEEDTSVTLVRRAEIEAGERWYRVQVPPMLAESVMNAAKNSYSAASVGSPGRNIDHERALRSAVAAATYVLDSHRASLGVSDVVVAMLAAARDRDDKTLRALTETLNGSQLRALARDASTLAFIANRVVLEGPRQ